MKLIKYLNEVKVAKKHVKFQPNFPDSFKIEDLIKILKQNHYYEFPSDMPKFKSIKFLGFTKNLDFVFSTTDDKNQIHDFIIHRFNDKWEIE